MEIPDKAGPPDDFKPHERPGEKIGGGYFVHRRGRWAGRIKPSQRPYEHPTLESALAEQERLSKLHPTHRYEVFISASEVIEIAHEITLGDRIKANLTLSALKKVMDAFYKKKLG